MIPLREYESFFRVTTWSEWFDVTRHAQGEYLVPWIVSNLIGVLLLAVTYRKPQHARRAWGFLLAGPCCIANAYVALTDSVGYQEYGVLAIPPMQRFIYSRLFSRPEFIVVPIAICQFVIGIELLFGDSVRRRKVALTGIIVFFLGLTTLGVGSAFPSSLLYALTMRRCWPPDTKSKLV